MAILQEYYRPSDVDEALAFLDAGRGRLVPLAGGTLLVGQLETRVLTDVEGVVDLRDVGLEEIREVDAAIHIGAMCTLSGVTDHHALHELADGLLVRAARGEGPVNLRNAATVGGVVATAQSDSEFYAALLALDATVSARCLDGTEVMVHLSQFDAAGFLITELQIPHRATRGGAARVTRTPSDRPIVAAYAVRETDGPKTIRVALCGVAPRPVLAGFPLQPPDDYKGSAEYRLVMSEIVTQRAVAEAEKVDLSAG